MKDLFEPKEKELTDISNPNNMRDSYTIYFDEQPSLMSHSGTEETDGKLMLSSGQTEGTSTSNLKATDNNVTHCELRTEDNMEITQDTYNVTNDGANTWEVFSPNDRGVYTFTSTGKTIGIKLNLKRTAAGDTSPIYESISLLTKTEE